MQGTRNGRTGIEGYVLALALLIPLALMGFAVVQLSGLNVAMPSTLAYADNGERLVTSHPAPLNQAPPPTLAPPTPTTRPTPAPVTPTAVPTPAPRTYTVQRGDELKHIAAQYGVTISFHCQSSTLR